MYIVRFDWQAVLSEKQIRTIKQVINYKQIKWDFCPWCTNIENWVPKCRLNGKELLNIWFLRIFFLFLVLSCMDHLAEFSIIQSKKSKFILNSSPTYIVS